MSEAATPEIEKNYLSPVSRAFWRRVSPFWTDRDLLKPVEAIQKHARKAARTPYTGHAVVAATSRIEMMTNMPSGYRLSVIGRQYGNFDECEQLIVILASRIGDPQIGPAPPVWPILAMVLLEWRNTLAAETILARAAKMGMTEEVQRGLVIVTYLFPELESWFGELRFRTPLWERVFAVPLAARRLLSFEKNRA